MSLGDFFEHAQFLFDVGCAAQITSVCVRSMPEKQWVSFTTKIVLAPEAVLRDDAPSVLVDLPTFRVVRSVVAAGDAKTFLTEVANGIALRARLPRDVGHDIRFVNDNNTDAAPQFYEGPELYTRLQARDFGLPCAAWVHAAGGPTLGNYLPGADLALKRIDRQLAAQRTPFIGFKGLSRDLGLRARGFTRDYTGSVEFVAPFWTWIDAASATPAGELAVGVSSQIDALAARVTLAVDPVEMPRMAEKRLLPLTAGEWKVETSAPATRRLLRLMTRAPTVLSLNFDGESIQQERVGAGNLRVLAHQYNDDLDLEMLRKKLFGENSDLFEEGVAQLLHLCGFAAEHIAGKREAVDVVAFAATDDVLFVECTLRELDMKKLDKLAARARSFEDMMERRVGEEGGHVRRALFMPVRRKAVAAATLEAVEQHGVMLVCKEEIELIIEMALRGEPPTMVLSEISLAGRERIFETHPKE